MKPLLLSRRRFLALAGAATAQFISIPGMAQSTNKPPAFSVGKFQKIYDPSIGEDKRWYINDHTFIRAGDGQWHLFGITHPEPAAPSQEKFFAHATAPDLMGPWTKQPPVMQWDPAAGETHVWAPYVLQNDGLYYMYYCAGGQRHEASRIHLATSKDLFNWERSPANPMLVDGFDARDPMVLRAGDQWVLYYCATTTPQGGNHTVKCVTGNDLLHWSDQREVFRSPAAGKSGGPTESPFVVARNGKFYLFVCTNVGYNQTAAYESDSAFHWDVADEVGLFPSHAAEIVVTPEGKWYASRAGWRQGGVYLAELTWNS
jgi:predicted GH43/DUF377 family glycosyl hydrolase